MSDVPRQNVVHLFQCFLSSVWIAVVLLTLIGYLIPACAKLIHRCVPSDMRLKRIEFRLSSHILSFNIGDIDSLSKEGLCCCTGVVLQSAVTAGLIWN